MAKLSKANSHELLVQAYSPMTIRFFILQAQYRSTVDFSNEALQASEKGLNRLMDAINALHKITPNDSSSAQVASEIKALREKCYEAMNDDLNSPIVIAHLFDGTKLINNIIAGNATITSEDLELLKETFHLFCFDILGLKEKEYFLLTINRHALIENKENFKELVERLILESHGTTIVAPLHTYVRDAINELNIKAPNLHILPPQSYLSFGYLTNKAKAIITDSGNVAEEATFLGIPCQIQKQCVP